MVNKRKANVSTTANNVSEKKQRKGSTTYANKAGPSASETRDTTAWPEYFHEVCSLSSIIESRYH